jgi:hypothetical protein
VAIEKGTGASSVDTRSLFSKTPALAACESETREKFFLFQLNVEQKGRDLVVLGEVGPMDTNLFERTMFMSCGGATRNRFAEGKNFSTVKTCSYICSFFVRIEGVCSSLVRVF